MAVNAMCVCEYCDSYVPIYIVFTRWQKIYQINYSRAHDKLPCVSTLFDKVCTRSCRGMQCLFNRLIFSLFLHVLHLSTAIMCLLFYNHLEIIILS